jgi:hypothetical protein
VEGPILQPGLNTGLSRGMGVLARFLAPQRGPLPFSSALGLVMGLTMCLQSAMPMVNDRPGDQKMEM